MDANLVAKSLSFHGQPLQKIWEGERGIHDLYRLGITNPDYSVYTMRQKNFTFQDRAKRLKLHQFIAKKATFLFDSDLITDDHGIKSKHKEKFIENTVIMPPFESFINKTIDKNRHIHKIIEIIQPGDIIYGQIIQRSSSGLLVKVLCTGEPLYRYLADLTIKAYVLSQNMIPAHDKRGDQKPYTTNDYVCCEVLEISVDADRINLGMKGTLTIDEKAPLGLITAEQMPEYYKRTIQNPDISYTDLLENSENFFNPESEDILLEEIGIKSANCIAFSIMNSLKCNFPQQEFANELRQTQASKWAFRSVADGIEHFKVGRHTEAFQCLNKALSIDPRNVEGLVARGALYANSGSFKKAVTDFETALKLNPYHANARKYMGETLVALGRSYEEENRIDDARKAYKDCLIIIPHHEEAKSSLEFLNGKAAANQINKQLIDTNELLPGFKSSMKNSSELITVKDSKRNNSGSSDGFNKKDKLSKKKKKKDKNRHRHHRNHHKRKNVSSSSSDSDNDDDDDTSDDTGSSTTSKSDTDESTDDSSSTTADSRSSSKSATNAGSRQKSKGVRSNKNDDNDNNDSSKYNRQKSLSPLSKRMAIMDEQNSLSTTTTARYHFNQPFHLANTTASTSGMSAMAAMGGTIESDGGGIGVGGVGSDIPSSSQQIFGPGTSSASKITSVDTNLIRHQQDYQHSLTSLSTAATVDTADDYDTKVRNFLEMTRDEEDYESRVRSLVEEVSKYRKERKTSSGIGGGGGSGFDRFVGDDAPGGGGISSSGGGGDFDSSGSKKKKDKKKQKKIKKEQKKSKKKKDKEKKSSSTSSHRHHGDRSSSIDIDNMELKEAIEIVKSIPMLDFESKLTADLQKYEKSIDISHRNIPSTSKMTTSEYFCQDSESSSSDNNETHQKIGDERKRIRESISTMKKFSNPSSRFSRNNLHLNESSFAATIGQKMISSSSSAATKAPVVLDKFGCFRLAAPDEKVDLPTMMTSNTVSAASVAAAAAATAATATTSTIKKRSNSLSPHRHYNSRSRSRSSRSRSRYRRGSSRSPRRSRSARRSKSPQRHSRSRSRRKSRSVRRSLRNSPRRSSPPSRWSPRRRSPRRRSRSTRRSRTPPHGKSFSRRSVSRTGGGGVGRTSRSRSRSRSVHRRSRSPVNRRSRSIEFSGGRRRRSFSRSVSYNRSRSRSPWRRGRGRSGGGFRGGRGHFSYRGRSRGRGGGFRGGRRSPFFRNRNYSPDRSPPPPSSSVHRRDDENLNRSATKSNKGRKDGIEGKWTHDKYEKSGSVESDDKLQATSNQNEENWDEEDTGNDAVVAGGSGNVTSTDIAADTAADDPNEPTVEEIDKIINKAQKERKEEILQRDKDLLKKPTPTNLPF